MALDVSHSSSRRSRCNRPCPMFLDDPEDNGHSAALVERHALTNREREGRRAGDVGSRWTLSTHVESGRVVEAAMT